MEKGEIWQRKSSGEFVEIREVTHICGDCDKPPAYVVASGDCTFLADARTTIGRQAMEAQLFLIAYRKWVEIKNNIMDIEDTSPVNDLNKSFKKAILDLKRRISKLEEE